MISEKILCKEKFNISDFSKMVDRKSDTIRSWELKGIIKKANINPINKWREYTKEEIIENLKIILNHPWDRDVFANREDLRKDIKEYIDRLENPLQCSLKKQKLL